MKTYEHLSLKCVAEKDFRKRRGVSYSEAKAEIGVCSLTAVFIKNDDGEVVEKERVWMTPGGAWMKTTGYADIGTVKGTWEGLPVIREAKYTRVGAVTLDEAQKAIGACCLAKVVLCDAEDIIVENDDEPKTELVWLSLSGTYWARQGGHISTDVGLAL